MIDLVDLIQTQCVPQRNCLLTVTDSTGESGFLYFRDAELIEANFGTIWGRDAFDKIITWSIAHHSLSDLPMGIKRAIWEPVDAIIEEVLGTKAGEKVRSAFRALPDTYDGEEAGPMEQTGQLDARRMAFMSIREQPHFLALFLIEEAHGRLLFSVENRTLPPAEWLASLFRRLGDIGQSLGGGRMRGSCIWTELYMIWLFEESGTGVIVLTEIMEETHTFLAETHKALAVLK